MGELTISTPEDIPLIVEQISRCLSLAENCESNVIEEALLNLARRLRIRALELGAERDSLPKIPGLAELN